MKKVTVVGVPEHFNLPWQLCIENNEFHTVGIDLQWKNIPEGTGKMCEMLREGSTDLAIILTEGILKDIAHGNPSLLIQNYVLSPLQWGIFVAANSTFQSDSELANQKVAISRYGSGSQLMAMVHAKQQGWNNQALSFEVVHTLAGGIDALTHQKADYFMWDRFMTQPLVDQGIFRRVGICPTPWPSFVLVGRKGFVQQNQAVIDSILDVINTTTREFKQIPSIDKTVSERYEQSLATVDEWLQVTQWSQKRFTKKQFEEINSQLIDWDLIEAPLDFDQVVMKVE